ncbi:MAG TPA: ankyrin repeat domain-containing protein, partial [Longimicrobium sp.]|nr:ankyrin repeat domain-containing protein [Longimicrobium sp.]
MSTSMSMSALRLSDGAGGVIALRLEPTPLGSGGDGSVYASTSHPELVAKLYHDPERAPERRRKLLAMLGTPPQLDPIHHAGHRYVQLTWPTHLVEDAEGRFRGYAMPRVELDRAVLAESLLSRKTRQAYGLPEAYGLRVTAASNLAAVVEALNARGHHVVDLKPVNAYVYRDTFFVALLDCDGFSVQDVSGERFPAHQYTPDYIAPEALVGELAPEALGEAQDRFALAVVVFQLLNGGVHPCQGVPAPGVPVPPSTTERMTRWMYAYGRRPNRFLRPSPWSIHEAFDDATRDLFDRAFGEDPAARPDAGEWRRHLARYADPASGALRRCVADPAHALFADGPGTECLQCALDAKRGAAVQAARPRPAPAPAPAGKTVPRPVRPPAPPAGAGTGAAGQRGGPEGSSTVGWVIGLTTAAVVAVLALSSNPYAVAPAGPETPRFTRETCPLLWEESPPDTIQALLSRGLVHDYMPDKESFDVSYTDLLGRNALHWSVRMGARFPTEGLVSGGVPVDRPDRDGVTPLMLAAGRGDPWHVEFLLGKGANAAATNAAGQTPLMYLAASCKFARVADSLPRGPEPALRHLLAAGVDLDAQDRRGHTALMHATRASGLRVRDLLVAGADPHRVDRSGRTALDIVRASPYSPDNGYIEGMLERVMDAEGWSSMTPEEREAYLGSESWIEDYDELDHPYRPYEIPPD